MSVRIEIHADNGSDAAAELKRLADGLAIMGLVQQRALQGAMLHHPQEAKNEELAEAAESTKQAATAEQSAAEKAEKTKRGRKPKAAKQAANNTPAPPPAPVVPEQPKDDEPAENPNPYRLFDENGAEEELFDTPDAYRTALISMFKDAPDEMTCTSVGKSNEETVKRLQEEGVDFKDIIDAYQGRLAELKAKKAEPAAEKQPEAVEPVSTETVTLDEVRNAITQLASAKGLPAAVGMLKKFGNATKANEVPDARRAEFVKACEEAAA